MHCLESAGTQSFDAMFISPSTLFHVMEQSRLFKGECFARPQKRMIDSLRIYKF